MYIDRERAALWSGSVLELRQWPHIGSGRENLQGISYRSQSSDHPVEFRPGRGWILLDLAADSFSRGGSSGRAAFIE